MKFLIGITILLFFSPFSEVNGQNNDSPRAGDSLSLPAIINKVINDYPSINKAKAEIDAANARIGLAKSAYYPDITINSGYSYIGPTSSITVPGMGTFSLYPSNNYNAVVNLNQIIYDFGKTAKSVSFEQQNKELAQLSEEQIKQRLSLLLAGTYYSLVFLQEAILIKDEELATLNEHLHFVEKKASTGSATQYDILTTKVRISTIENQKTDLFTSLQIQQSQLNMYLDQPERKPLLVKNELSVSQPIATVDSLIDYALAHRYEMKIVRQKSSIAEARFKMVNTQNNPVFSFTASGGFKNGYLPDLGVPKANYVVGVGLKIPVFDATRAKYSSLQVRADMQGIDQDAELTRRTIINDVIECHANSEASLKKVTQSELQLKQATKAYELAQTSFSSGVITNLDLLDCSTSVAESQLALLKTKIDYTLNLLKLKTVLGERLF